jgi:hypothetical protein
MSILSKLTQRHTVKHKNKKATGRQREQLNVEIDPALNVLMFYDYVTG